MPKLMYISTIHTKGIYGTAIVQCAAACKWLQSGSGLVDAGLVDACVNQPRDEPTLAVADSGGPRGPGALFEIAISLFGIWHNKMFDFNSHQWCVNLPRG